MRVIHETNIENLHSELSYPPEWALPLEVRELLEGDGMSGLAPAVRQTQVAG